MTDLSDTIEQIDRVHQFFADRPDPEVYAELHRLVAALEADPRTAAIFGELVDEFVARLCAVQERDEALARQLVAIRDDMLRELPQLADAPEDLLTGPDVDPFLRTQSMAHVDELASRRSGMRLSLLAPDNDDGSLTTALIRIVRTRLKRLGEDELYPAKPQASTVASELMRRVRNVEVEHSHRMREWLLYTRTTGCASATRLVGIVQFLNPQPEPLAADFDPLAFLNRSLAEMWHPFSDLRAKTFGERVERANAVRDAEIVAMMRTEARRTYEEIRRRLLSTRSHRALVLRFAQRVQLYERKELYELAKKSPRRVEDTLTHELARFLFDHGLNPLTKANLGTTQPDLLDPTMRWTFYVEAKQYGDGKGRSVVLSAVKQVADTLLRVRALPNGVREAFLVVFRVGGPLLVLPRELHLDGVRIWPILVDLAPSSETGSRQKRAPVVLTTGDLLPSAMKS